MHVTIVQGSPRRHGNTETAVERLAARLRDRAAVAVVTLAELRVERCTGCRRCMREGICAIRDDDFPPLCRTIAAAHRKRPSRSISVISFCAISLIISRPLSIAIWAL